MGSLGTVAVSQILFHVCSLIHNVARGRQHRLYVHSPYKGTEWSPLETLVL